MARGQPPRCQRVASRDGCTLDYGVAGIAQVGRVLAAGGLRTDREFPGLPDLKAVQQLYRVMLGNARK